MHAHTHARRHTLTSLPLRLKVGVASVCGGGHWAAANEAVECTTSIMVVFRVT